MNILTDKETRGQGDKEALDTRQPPIEADSSCASPAGSSGSSRLSNFAIRPYENGDYAMALALWEEANLRPYTEPELARLLASGGGALVATVTAKNSGENTGVQDMEVTETEEIETVIGVVLWSHNGSMGILWRLAVSIAQRGQGVATRLLDRVEHDIRAAGFGGVTLLTRESNTVARSMYARRGYKWVEPLQFWGKNLPAPADISATNESPDAAEEQTSC